MSYRVRLRRGPAERHRPLPHYRPRREAGGAAHRRLGGRLRAPLAYVWIDGDGAFEHLFNEDLLRLGYARTTSFAHTYSRRFSALEDEAREASAGLWGTCPVPSE